MQGARDRRGGQGEHVDLGAQLLEPLLVGDAEALLLVDDDQPQILEAHVALQKTVGPDQNVDLSLLEPGEYLLLLRDAAQARDHLDIHRVVGETLAEGLPVLARQHRGRHQHRHLLAVLHRLERRPDGHLGLAVADIAAHQAVHRPLRDHVVDDLFDGRQLVRCLLVGEGGLELAEHPVGLGVRMALAHVALRLDFEQVAGHLLGGGPGPQLGLLPGRTAHFVEARHMPFAADVLLHPGDPLDRQVQLVAGGVLEVQEIALDLSHLQVVQSAVAADAVVGVDDEIAFLELCQR